MRRIFAATAIAVVLCTPAFAQDKVRPGDDFYRYANGDWLNATSLPEGASSYGTTAMLIAQNKLRVRDLIVGSQDSRISDYYASQMDVEGIEAKGLTPLASDLASIDAIGDRRALSAWLGRAMRLDDGTNSQTDGLFGLWVHQNFHDPDHYAAHLVQGGLGLDRDAYGDASARETYRAHIAAVLKLAGLSDSDARAASVITLEAEIAKAHASAEDAADVVKTDNSWHRGDLAVKAPGMDWDAWLMGAGLDQRDNFVVWQPSAVIGSSALVASQPLATWKDYLTFHLIEHYAAVLPKAFGAQSADRQAQAIAATNGALGEAVGQLYVARYYPPAFKAAAASMAENLRLSFRAHIDNAAWMSPQARVAALAKLETLTTGVGYPDQWTDYSAFKVVRGDAYGNLRRAEAFAYDQSLVKLGRPVDIGEWALLPQSVGAILNFSPNSLQFSAGVLQPPYFDPEGDLASNYGSAGAGMAHELSHTFDELGRLYDAQGRLGDWWTADDEVRFHAMAAPLVAQYNAYCPQSGLCLNGKQVEGESVGDLVGLQVAHDAYLRALGGKPDVVINGLTGEQRFFLAFAQRWRKVQSEAALRQQIATDTHAPGEYRADTVRNVDAWYDAFGIKPGDKLYLKPEDRVRLW